MFFRSDLILQLLRLEQRDEVNWEPALGLALKICLNAITLKLAALCVCVWMSVCLSACVCVNVCVCVCVRARVRACVHVCITTDDPTVGKPLQSEAGLSLSEWRWAHHVGATWRTNGAHCWHAQVAFQKTQVQRKYISIWWWKTIVMEIRGKTVVIMSFGVIVKVQTEILSLTSFCQGPWTR